MKIKQLVLLILLCNLAMGQTGNGPLKFNEYSFSNVSTINDPLGATGRPDKTPDWIELRNNTHNPFGASNARMQISGWYISDDIANLHKWQIPYYNNLPIILDSGQSQMIFLCGHDKAVAGLSSDVTGVGLHANFSVNQTAYGGVKLYLTKSINATTFSDTVTLRITKPDHSWGKCWEQLYPQPTCTTNCTFFQNDNKWYLYPSPTPGAPNPRWPAYFTAYLPKPVFDVKPGYYGTLPAQINISDTSKLGLTGFSSYPVWGTYTNYPSICIIATNDCTTPDTLNTTGVGTASIVTTFPATLGTPVTGPMQLTSQASTTWTPPPSGYMIRAVMHDGSAMYPPTITGTVSPSYTAVPRYLDSFETYGAYYDSLYKTPVTFACVDTNTLFGGAGVQGMAIDYFDKTGVEIMRNTGIATTATDFFNNLGVNSGTLPRKQWQFNFRAEDEYGYSHTNKYQFFQDPIVGPSMRNDFPSLIFRSGSEESFMYSTFLGPNQYPPSHVRDYFNHTMTMRHKLDFEQMHYTPTYMMINGINKGIYYIKEPFDSTYTDYYFAHPRAAILANGVISGASPLASTPFMVQPYAGFGTGTYSAAYRWSSFYSWAMLSSTKVHIPAIYDQLSDSLDFQSLNDYTIYNMLSVNTEYLNRSAYWWKGLPNDTSDHRESKWRMALANTDDTWGFDQNNYNNVPSVPNSAPCDFITAFGLPGWPIPGPPYTVPANNSYPLMALWYKLMDNDTFEHAFLARYGDLLNSALSCDSLHDHFKYIRSTLDSTRDMPSHVWWLMNDPNLIGYDSLHYWKSALDSMNSFITQRCSLVTEAMSNCFGKAGPYNLCIDATPDKSGWVQLNSLSLKSFVWNGKYLDSVNMMAKAYPEQNYVFDHWETTPSNYPLRPDNKSDSIGFYVSSDVCLKAVFKLRPPDQTYGTPQVPTGFSPNGDGNNDVFNVYGIAEATTYEMEIYNRWGELIFRSIDKSHSWDGKFNGVDVPAGVYAYRCQIMINGKPFKQKGNVTLLR